MTEPTKSPEPVCLVPRSANATKPHGHRVVRVHGKGGKVVLVPLPPAVSRAVDRAAGERARGPLLRNQRGTRMDRHAANRRLHRLAMTAGVRLPRESGT